MSLKGIDKNIHLLCYFDATHAVNKEKKKRKKEKRERKKKPKQRYITRIRDSVDFQS